MNLWPTYIIMIQWLIFVWTTWTFDTAMNLWLMYCNSYTMIDLWRMWNFKQWWICDLGILVRYIDIYLTELLLDIVMIFNTNMVIDICEILTRWRFCGWFIYIHFQWLILFELCEILIQQWICGLCIFILWLILATCITI